MMTRRPLFAALAAAALPGRAHAQMAQAAGEWTGVLDAGAALRLRLRIESDGAATLFSLDQGGTPIPARARIDGNRVIVEAPTIRGKFEGAIAGDTLAGTWTQGGRLPLTFRRGDAGLVVAPAAPLTPERLAAWRTEAGSPALTAGVLKRGGQARVWTVGERAVGSGIAATDTDRWHIGSITKSFTATLVARLVDAGAVRWDDTVGETLASVPMREEYKAVTFRHLLSHRAGLKANIPIVDLLRFQRVNPDPREERRAFARTILAMAPQGPPETTFEYANNGYVLAGAMLEAKLGAPWEALLRQHVLEPLGLTSAGFGAPGAEGRTDEPVGHAKQVLGDARRAYRIGEGVTDNVAALGPAGTLHLRLADLLSYLAAHRDRTALLRAESWQTLHTPPFGGDYAMGWIVKADGARWHNGSNTLWYAEAQFNAESGVAAAAAANDGWLEKASPAVGRALAAAAAA